MDARVVRTRAGLQRALLDLALDRPLDDITVNDIVDRAGVNRSSFYQHYGDKEVLLADALEQMIADMSPSLSDIATRDVRAEMPEELRSYVQFVFDHGALFRQVLGPSGSALVTRRLTLRIDAIVRGALSDPQLAGAIDVPVDVIAAAVTGTAMGVIVAWLAHDPLPPVEVAARWLWTMLTAPVPVSLHGMRLPDADA